MGEAHSDRQFKGKGLTNRQCDDLRDELELAMQVLEKTKVAHPPNVPDGMDEDDNTNICDRLNEIGIALHIGANGHDEEAANIPDDFYPEGK